MSETKTSQKTAVQSQKITKEEIPKINQVIEQIEKDPKSFEFLEPVDHVGLGLVDYLTLIKTPMDLSTIKKKLKANKYTIVQEVLDDIQLIWTNCKTYNAEGSEIFKMAVSLEKLTKKIVDKVFKKPVEKPAKKSNQNVSSIQTPVSAPEIKKEVKEEVKEEVVEPENPNGLSAVEKITLTEKVRKLTNDGLAAFVRLVEKECEKAIEDLDKERLQIRIDMIDRKTFGQINQLIDTLLKSKEEKKTA